MPVYVRTHPQERNPKGKAVRFRANVSFALDPATTDRARSDASGITIVACDAQDTWWVYEADPFRGQPDAVIERCLYHAKLYRPSIGSIEAVAAQVLYKHLLEPKLEEAGLDMQLIEYRAANKLSKHARISALQPRFKQGKIKLRRGLTRLLYELENYAGPDSLDHDDLLDSLSQHLVLARPPFSSEVFESGEVVEREVAPSKRGERAPNEDPCDGTWIGERHARKTSYAKAS